MADPDLAAELGPGVRVIKQNRGVFDTMPISLLTTQSLAGLGQLVGADLAPQRFRPNILVEARRGDFPEDDWVGRKLRVGGLWMRVDQRDQRCFMVAIDPLTLDKNPAVLRAIARDRDTASVSTARPLSSAGSRWATQWNASRSAMLRAAESTDTIRLQRQPSC